MKYLTAPARALIAGRAGRSPAMVIRLLAVGTALAAVSVGVLRTSEAAFSSQTENASNSFAAGTVVLGDDDSNAVMFNMTNMSPGSTQTKCINVTYTGSLAADVKLYGAATGSLGQYIDTVVDVGTGAAGGNTFGCTGFTPSSNLHTGTLAGFASARTNYSNGLSGFTGATNPTTRSYRITATLQDDNAAQGLSASATFTWEAQNT